MRERVCLIALAAATAMFAAGRPALAGVTAASINPANQNYTGNCPTTLKFSGSIAYSAGTKFTYSFNRFVNGVQQVVNGGVVNSGSGTLAVSDAMTISSAAGGSTFDQIWVHNISGGQSDVYSNKAVFTVSCTSPFNPNRPKAIPIHFNPNAPTNLLNASDSTKYSTLCYSKINQLFCDASYGAGDVVLLWDWSDTQWPNIDGFRLFRVDKGQHNKVQDTTLGDAVKGTFVHPVPGGACYAVAALSGAAISSDSNAVCLNGGALVKTDEYGPIHVKYTSNSHGNVTGLSNVFGNIFGKDTYAEGIYAVPSFGKVGYAHWDETHLLGDNYSNHYWRSGVAFDMGALVGRHIYKAQLKLSVASDYNDATCTTWIAPGVSAWWNDGNSMIERQADAAVSTGRVPGPNLAYDVTSIVQSWVQGGASNFGFVLYQDDENLGAFTNSQCVTHFNANPALDVTHD